PGGTTAAGLDVLKQNDTAAVIRRAVRAATERSRELGNR
ncbi:MAG: pyrroline-5-carboxylate reductase, partial [Candidatus Sumerlaeia bacterium]|nr:pyrroline-5-carboxylate reductase [Candidatus Sumerlaeia bacterium]